MLQSCTASATPIHCSDAIVNAEDISKPVGFNVGIVGAFEMCIGIGVAIAPPERNCRTAVCPRVTVVMITSVGAANGAVMIVEKTWPLILYETTGAIGVCTNVMIIRERSGVVNIVDSLACDVHKAEEECSSSVVEFKLPESTTDSVDDEPDVSCCVVLVVKSVSKLGVLDKLGFNVLVSVTAGGEDTRLSVSFLEYTEEIELLLACPMMVLVLT